MAQNIYSFYRRWQPGFRARRMRQFIETFRPTAQTTILDVGGVFGTWTDLPEPAQITVLNLDDRPEKWERPANIRYCIGDGRALDFPDGSFDIVYSNSVIEHLGNWADQQRFAAEMLRVGRGLWVQTPNRWFPIEPHFLTPGVHWLPRACQPALMRWCSVRGWLRRGDNIPLDTLLAELRLLSAGEMRSLFPGCQLVRERLAGFTKSLIAVRTWPPDVPGVAIRQ